MVDSIQQGRARRARLVALAALCGLVAGLGGCASFKTHSDWDPQYDFARLQTWRWADVSQTPTGMTAIDTDDLLAQRVMRSVEEALAARGYVKTSTSEGDFEVAWFVTVEPKTKVTTVTNQATSKSPSLVDVFT